MKSLTLGLLILLAALPVAAQGSDCWMYDDDCYLTKVAEIGYENIYATLVAATLQAPVATPTPFGVELPDINMPANEMYQALATANAGINSAPANLSAPGGLSIVPNPNSAQMFGYVKWLLSPATAEEYGGPVAPIIVALGSFVTLNFILALVYLLVFGVSYVIRWVAWLFRLFLSLLDIFLQIIQAVGSAIGAALDLVGGWLGKIIRVFTR